MIRYKIFKINLLQDLTNGIELPKGAKILSVQSQYNRPVMWFQFDVENELDTELRYFLNVETGKEFESQEGKRLEFIGTVKMMQDTYVLHCFEIKDY